MNQVNLYAQATIDGVRYQWLAYQDGELARIDMYQRGPNQIEWARYPGLETRLHGGTVEGLLEKTVTTWIAATAADKAARAAKATRAKYNWILCEDCQDIEGDIVLCNDHTNKKAIK